ncbi:hypothetical protein [Pontixanthobacter luteolus]|uniref:hypothetical protein n=1 Tax=Pontixanthobacter luteolus TaxID=295089 RepID=UPI001368E8AB|nr:hypothetical protein [Pontixanthobacter luteolus]
MTAKVLSLAAISDRIGMVFLIEGQLKDWVASETGALSTVAAAGYTQELINRYRPDVVLTEQIAPSCQKAPATIGLIRAMARTAERNEVLDVVVPRVQRYANKYEEAAALAEIYPALAPRVPAKRKYYDHQPRSLVIFEALALAHSIRSEAA